MGHDEKTNNSIQIDIEIDKNNSSNELEGEASTYGGKKVRHSINDSTAKKPKSRITIYIIIGCILLFSLITKCFSSTVPESEEISSETETKIMEEQNDSDNQKKDIQPINMMEGFDKLQSLFLQVDENYSLEDAKNLAESNDFYINVKQPHHYVLYVSEKEPTGKTGGFESAPTYDVDYVKISFFEDENKGKEYYAFSKEYCINDSELETSYTFHNNEIIVAPVDDFAAEPGDWDSVEDALRYALTQ